MIEIPSQPKLLGGHIAANTCRIKCTENVSLPALLARNYFWLSTMNKRPPLTSLASFLAICHTVNLASWMHMLKKKWRS